MNGGSFLALDHQRQRGRLHPAHGGEKKPAVARELKAVMARVPLMPSQSASERLRAASCQALHLRVAAQVVEAVADGLRRHALQPQALQRLASVPLPPFSPPAYCSIRRKISSPLAPASQALMSSRHVFALGLLDHGGQAVLVLSTGFQVEVRRDHRQVGKAPLAALDVKCSGAWISTRWPTALVTT